MKPTRMTIAEAAEFGAPPEPWGGDRWVDEQGDAWRYSWLARAWERVTTPAPDTAEEDPVSPSHYQGFSNGAEVIDITENLNSNGGQAIQYIARSTRLDGRNKGNPIEDLKKAAFFIQRELVRQGGE